MKRLRYLLLGICSALLVVELILRLLPVSTSTHADYYVHPDILSYPPRHEWTLSSGWDLRDVQHLRSNNFGFVADHDFSADPNAVGLVGDSYVEASMLPPKDRPAAQLERLLGGHRPVYAFGGPGSSLLDYGVRIRWAYEKFALRNFVVMLEMGDASQALCNSGNVHARCLEPGTLRVVSQRWAPAGWLKNVLRGSALAQYVNSQLKLTPARLTAPAFWRYGAPEGTVESKGPSPSVSPAAIGAEKTRVIDTAIDVFLREISDLDGLHLVFVVDMNRRNLISGQQRPDESYHVVNRLRASGFEVVHGEPLYRAFVSTSPLHLEVGPHDQHLNGLGVGLLMSAAAQALGKHPDLKIND